MNKFYDIHTSWDLVITPLYFVITYVIAHNYIVKFISEKHFKRLVRRSFLLKNALAIVFVFFFWYKYGYLMDMGSYFLDVKQINNTILSQENINIIDIYFRPEYVNSYSNLYLQRLGEDSTTTMPLLVLPLYYLGLGSIFGTIFIFNLLVFIASIYLYKVFVTQLNNYKKEIIISIFWLPGLILWAGGIYKDTFAYIGMCLLLYALFSFFIQKKYYLKYLFMIGVFSYLILITKPHILIIYVFIALWILRVFAKKMSPILRYAFYAIGLVLFMTGGQYAITSIAQSQLDAAKFTDIEKVTSIVEGFNNYYSDADAQGGSQYSIGTFEPSLQGLMKLMPSGYIVTFFRPYLWEFRSPVFVFNVLESFVLLSMTIYILFKWRLRVFKEIFKNEFLTFCFLYTLVLGAMIGIMSFNFGTLARYKTPVMPFFAFMVFVLFAKVRYEVKQKRKLKETQLHNPSITIIR